MVMEAAELEPLERSPGRTQNVEHPVVVTVLIGDGRGTGTAWGCDLSYDYVKINAEYTT
jgi:glutamate N-acetyltransferase/amino-acid N-acetyltransferase